MTRIGIARVALALCVLGASSAAAQTGTLNRFRASETNEDDFELSRASDFGDMRFGAQLTMDYAFNPLVYEGILGDPSSESHSVVEHLLTGTLGLALGLADRVVIFAGLPVVFLNEGDSMVPAGVAPADGGGLGDLYLGGRVRLFGEAEDVGALALQVTGTFPTSVDSTYRGDPFLTIHPELLAELRPGAGARIVINVGARLREETVSMANNLQFRHELTYAIGFAIPFWTDAADPRTHLDGHVQLYGASAFALVGEREGTALEALAGLKLFHESGIVAGLAMGPGLNRGFGSPDLRAVLNIGWMMPRELAARDRDGDGLYDDVDQCPDEPEDFDQFQDEDGCPDPDNDGDGILDVEDRCPNEPGPPETQGCPTGDRDGDGLLDHVDQCPDEPEDFDGFEDENGCPDPDNDGDGIPDTQDACPNEPGPRSNQGCPDPDRDGDTVVDRVDNCPDEPGPPENQGCPEPQQVVLQEGRLEILDMVYFQTNRATILARSFPLLQNVARVLNAHPEIQLVRVEGHTDSRGRRANNVRLSQQRAESVVRFLTTQGGVDASRLEAHGYGPDRPVVENASTAEEHAQNRRVEFNIPNVSGIEQRRGGAGSDTIDR
ncbi:MAG: OmpA family protein [Sandaracinaceae bacterium]|nr:OmpA family protein [Sandaracinaceae bacterium]